MSNSSGQRFCLTTFGESHGTAMGVIIDGCPSGHTFPLARIQAQLQRRRPGQSKLTSQRGEPDEIEVLSGIDPQSRQTLGTPIAMLVRNKDVRSGDYDELAKLYRPSHADFTYDAKYGLRDQRGGGRASARETVARVAAGTLAEDILDSSHGIHIVAWVASVGDIVAPSPDLESVTRDQVDRTPVRCPDDGTARQMIDAIEMARKDGDTIGGVVRCIARGVPVGLGEPVFDKLTADLAKAMLSLPATRGFEIGEGFAATRMRGSEHNDAFYYDEKEARIATRTNHSGGIQGGISNGETICFSVAFKPVATIFKPQQTVTIDGQPTTFSAKGRHDPCVVPRAVPLVESMTAVVLLDHLLRLRMTRVQGSIG